MKIYHGRSLGSYGNPQLSRVAGYLNNNPDYVPKY